MSEQTASDVKDADALRTLLTRDDILDADDLRFETVPTDEWKQGTAVRVVQLYAEARDELEQFLTSGTSAKDLRNIRARFASMCVVNEKNERLFTEADVTRLGMKSAIVIDRIFQAAQRVNEVSDAAVASKAENSPSEGSDTSSSPSL